VIDYETWCRIRHHVQEGLTIIQTAQALSLHRQTVAKWARVEKYQPRRYALPRSSHLDPYKGLIVRWLDEHPLSGQQIFQRLREQGYSGGLTIVRNYIRRVRPKRAKAFLTLHFARGECAQVDWGSWGSIAVGDTRRKLSFFVYVLCHSRMMYLEFTVAQTMEHFLSCHERAFAALGVPQKIMVDNLKSAVLRRLVGEAPVLNPKYLDFSRHHGFEITPCNVRSGWEKGRVESGVGYVKKNLLNGLDLPDFSGMNPAAQIWLNEIANVRIHGETHRRPIDMFQEERAHLRTPNPNPFDLARVITMRASPQFRIRIETNKYSVPAEYAGRMVTVKAWPDRVCIYHQDQLIARHSRTYDRRKDVEDPDHPKELLQQRRNAREQRLLSDFLALSNAAAAYYDGLLARSLNARVHMRRILATAEIYGREATARAITDALAFNAFSSQYIIHLLDSRARAPQLSASPIALTRRQDLLQLQLPEPDLSIYKVSDDE
jgi:transposase